MNPQHAVDGCATYTLSSNNPMPGTVIKGNDCREDYYFTLSKRNL